MKKLILTLVMAVSFLAGHAITLFPHFVDVAGDFEDGTTDKFVTLDIPTTFWRVSPFFYSSLKEADAFLKDTLPFSNYPIADESLTLPDGTEIVKYSSMLEPDNNNKERISVLVLVQSPDEPLYVGIYEGLKF